MPGIDWQESQLLELTDGRLRVFIRVLDQGVGKLLVADSADEGRTWTKPYALKSMDNPNSRFQVIRLQSGRVLFLCHGRPEKGGKDGQGRTALSAYLSEDDGATWKGGLVLDPGIGSYPDCCQGPDGTIYVTHDNDRPGKAEIRFCRFTEEDVLVGKIVSPRGKLGVLVMKAMSSAYNRTHR